ncbi:hypothetical protein ACIGJO_08300 [Streptomyces sp. NPDC079020]|uniref:hypothetical protein n=1 Tax=Streptomyces sp. NPDC079020 TaxID=3365722 RepID=UPI0037D35733
MTRTRLLLTALAAATVLATAGAGYWYTTFDDMAATQTLCLPEDTTDRDKAGNVGTVAIVTVDRTVEYREEEPELEGGVVMSAVTVTEPLKGAPPASMVIGQSAVLDAKGRALAAGEPDYAPLRPGRRYVIGLTDTHEYRDGWVWFAVSADGRLGRERARWKDAVAHQNAPRADHRCDDVTAD